MGDYEHVIELLAFFVMALCVIAWIFSGAHV